MSNLILGIMIGVGATLFYLGLVIVILEWLLRPNPFQDVTIEDFLPHSEGG